MKKLAKLLGIAAIGAVIGLGLAGCPTDSDGGTGDNTALTGTIKIQKNGSDVTTAATGDILIAVYSGSESVSYQWNRNGAAAGTGRTHSPAETGRYTVTVSAAGYQNKTSAAVTVTGSLISPGETRETAIPLTENLWSDGVLKDNSSQQWFTFTATVVRQYIHGNFNGTGRDDVYVQLYDIAGVEVGSQALLSSNTNAYYLVTADAVYYIKTTINSSLGGSFQIGFTGSDSPPSRTSLPTEGVTTLSGNTYADSLSSLSGLRWFRFTATAATQYIHTDSNNPSQMAIYVHLYDSAGAEAGSHTSLDSTTTYSVWTVTPGTMYYIKASVPLTSAGREGMYQIGFTNSSTPPPITLPVSGVTMLAANTWANVNSDDEIIRWFSFTATAVTQYIHAEGIYVRLYDSTGIVVGLWTYITSLYTTPTLTPGGVYYIAVFVSRYAAEQIGLTDSSGPLLGGATATTLAVNADWTDSSLSADGEQWFKFTASKADFECINFNFIGTLRDSVYVQFYDSADVLIDGPNLITSAYWPSAGAADGVYYIKVTSDSSGTYQIKFTNNEPTGTTLTVARWPRVCNITKGDEQWFSFTATAATQYIHGILSNSTNMRIYLYDNGGNSVAEGTINTTNSFVRVSPISGAKYYIKVRLTYGNTASYYIGFSTSSSPPTYYASIGEERK
jgi:hypothetical protein